MANLLDYLSWRGDLTLAQDPFNEVDNLILAELSYVDFRGIVPPPGQGEGVPLYAAAEAFLSRYPEGKKIDFGVLLPDTFAELLRCLASSPRFRDMRLSCLADELDTERGEQFAALTVETGDHCLYLSYRGTDDTLAGWKEDFDMTFMSEIPAQDKARQYLQDTARRFPRRKLRLGGHSKGGNLAVYAAAFCPLPVQRRIDSVWSNDGPGFLEDFLELPQYWRIEDRVHTIVPKSSVVGMLLEHAENYTVVDSDQAGLLQHDGFSWQVLGNRFVTLRQVTRQAHMMNQELGDWVRSLSVEQRARFVDALFAVLTASGAQTLTDLKEDSLKAMAAMVRAMKDLDKETREGLLRFVRILLKGNLRLALEDIQEDVEKQLTRGRNK